MPNPPGPHAQATPHEKGSAVDLYYDSVSYRRTAENMEQYFGRETSPMSVYGWVRGLSKKADAVLRPMKVAAGDVWVADEVVVSVVCAGGVSIPGKDNTAGGNGVGAGKGKGGMGNYRTLPYYSGKQGYGKAEWIASHLPWDSDSCYVEPFAGMAGVLFARPPDKPEMLNDLNRRVVNWWQVVQDQPEEFGWLVEMTPKSRFEYQ